MAKHRKRRDNRRKPQILRRGLFAPLRRFGRRMLDFVNSEARYEPMDGKNAISRREALTRIAVGTGLITATLIGGKLLVRPIERMHLKPFATWFAFGSHGGKESVQEYSTSASGF